PADPPPAGGGGATAARWMHVPRCVPALRPTVGGPRAAAVGAVGGPRRGHVGQPHPRPPPAAPVLCGAAPLGRGGGARGAPAPRRRWSGVAVLPGVVGVPARAGGAGAGGQPCAG